MRHCIRSARASDAQALFAIDAVANPNPWPERRLGAACAGGECGHEQVLVSVSGGDIGGFLVYSLVLGEASILSIAVRPALQRQGVGHLLMTAALAGMRQAGAARCLLEVRCSNDAAIRLYERNGFGVDGRRKNYYADRGRGPEDALLMSRAL